MGSFISRQPNGLYCRFSTVVGCPTHKNMTEQECLKYCLEFDEIKAGDELKNNLHPFDRVIEEFHADNMTHKRFRKFLSEVGYKGKFANAEAKQ